MSALWLTTSEADTYFATRLGASAFWASGTAKTAALTTAQSFLENCGLFVFPTTAAQIMKDAVCEQALFLLMHNTDRRMGLRAQGVVKAGVIKEEYKYQEEATAPLAPIIKEMLSAYDTTAARSVAIVGLDRDEEEDVS